MQKLGKQSLKFDKKISIIETASIVGPKESQGPLSQYFDKCLDDEFWGENSWEKAESKIIKETVNLNISKSGISIKDIDYCFAGDLINQSISSTFGLRDLQIPYYGIFGACSTFIEGLQLGSILLESGAGNNILCAASTHFCSAERQFRFPLELGNQRPPSAQWTVTGSGSSIISTNAKGPYITTITTGKMVDMGIKDANNMGAAMAPAALDTLVAHFKETGRSPNYYDAILTGDLGHIGKDILVDLAFTKGYNIKNNYHDCGVLIFDKNTQDVHAGGSGCACIATVFSGFVFNMLKQKKYQRVLLIATGALMNSMSAQQGESIPSIAHAISIEV